MLKVSKLTSSLIQLTPHRPGNTIPKYLQSELKTYPHKNLYTNDHSSIIHNSQKVEKCPSTNEWINKIWHVHTMEYYLGIERNEALIHAMTWMKVKNIMLNERPDIKDYILHGSIYI